MPFSLAELTEYLRIAIEALGRYRLRTALSVTGVVLGVAAVIAMMSVSEGAARIGEARQFVLMVQERDCHRHGCPPGPGP